MQWKKKGDMHFDNECNPEAVVYDLTRNEVVLRVCMMKRIKKLMNEVGDWRRK